MVELAVIATASDGLTCEISTGLGHLTFLETHRKNNQK